MVEMNVEELLSKLETTITLAKKGFMSDLKMVDEAACLECIQRIRDILPSELSQARNITKNAQAIIADAEARANEIIKKAEADAQKLVSESAIIDQANKEAYETTQNAVNYANNLANQAYADVGAFMDNAEICARQVLDAIMQKKAQLFPQYNQQQNMDDNMQPPMGNQ
jgi:vacuolar-type H+-ATPase subunit H